MKKVLAGADPEVWLTKNRIIVPSVGLIGGTKEAPLALPQPWDNEGLTVQEDNVTLELGWKPRDAFRFSDQVYKITTDLDRYLKTAVGKDYGFQYGPSHEFDPAALTSEQAQQFGCLPDQLAYSEGEFRKPLNPKDDGIGNFRFAGGHLHLGYDKAKARIPPWAVIRMMELGYLFSLNDGYDFQKERRSKYGLPGLYREKPYGVEYRTPGNYWLRQPMYAQYILNFGAYSVMKPKAAQKIYKLVDWDKVQESIMTETMKFPFNELNELYSELHSSSVEEEIDKEEVKAA